MERGGEREGWVCGRESVCERVGWVCVWEEGRVCVRGEGVCVRVFLGKELAHVVPTMADLLFSNLDKLFDQGNSLDEICLSAHLCHYPAFYLQNNHIT